MAHDRQKQLKCTTDISQALESPQIRN